MCLGTRPLYMSLLKAALVQAISEALLYKVFQKVSWYELEKIRGPTRDQSEPYWRILKKYSILGVGRTEDEMGISYRMYYNLVYDRIPNIRPNIRSKSAEYSVPNIRPRWPIAEYQKYVKISRFLAIFHR